MQNGNKYILVAIDHYSKWCEVKPVLDHTASTTTKFLEEKIICRYGIFRFVLTNNGGVWLVEFDNLCKVYGIHH
jgi:hypothetical protein